MSEQNEATGYKQELLAWANEAVVQPLLDKGPDAIGEVHQAIWQKVLQSYRNGQAAGPRPVKGARHAAPKTH
jgi:hypothetical protein